MASPRRRAALAALLLVVVTACAPVRVAVTPPGPILLAVVTWNTNAGRGDLPRLMTDLRSGTLTGRIPADVVILLQEATGGEQSDLFSFFSPVRFDGRRIRGNAILSTRPLIDPRVIELPAERQPRGAVAAAVDVGGHRVFVASAHLENRISWWKGGPIGGDAARGRQAAALLQALPADEHGILGGDMNSWLGDREPAWRDFIRRFDDTPRTREGATFRDRAVLDHLFFDLPPEWHASRWVIADAYGSDHHPVIGVIF